MGVRVPGALLARTITITAYQGDSAYGPLYAEPVNVRARVQGTNRVVRRPDGSTVTAAALATIRPTLDVPCESKVTAPSPITGAAQTYEVLATSIGEGPGGPAFIDLVLGGPRP